jgi:hypothetical protein
MNLPVIKSPVFRANAVEEDDVSVAAYFFYGEVKDG